MSLLLIMSGVFILVGVYVNIYLAKNIEYQYQEINSVLKVKSFVKLYSEYPKEGDYIGTLSIPVLDRVLPIYEGTSNKELKKGLGHFIKSALPGENNNSVLSGHRDTAFRKLNKLVIGDLLIVETKAGTFTYQVVETKIVSKNDKTIIVYTDHSVLTLTTCYPFNYIGVSSKRFIVRADLIQNV